ncbi:MAG: tetratricopeptide repeat protein [Chitinophagales bacterium]|nr:tetratricopeptide repeat protein [Chitinophagales bacterium]
MLLLKRLFTLSFIVLSTYYANAQSLADAQYAIWNEQPGKAKQILKTLLAANPTDAELNYRMGNLLFDEGKIDSAKMFYEKGIKPEDKTNYNFAGLGKIALKQGNTAGALEYFTKLTNKEKSKDAKAYLFAAEAYAKNKQYEQAFIYFDKAIALDPNNAESYMLKGDVSLESGDAGKAITNYEYAIEKKPNFAPPLGKIGKIYMSSRNYQEAKNNLTKANAADPNYLPAIRDLAEYNHLFGREAEAAKLMKEYIDKSGRTDVDILSRYASFVFLSKDYANTITIIEDLMKRDVQNKVLARLIAYSYYEQGKYTEGLPYLEKFLASVDTSKIIASDYAYYGKLLAKNAQDSLAIINLNKAIELDTADVDLFNDLAAIYNAQKKYLDMAQTYERKIAATKPNPQDYYQVGRGYYYGGQFAKADSAFAKVTEMQPTTGVTYIWRARSNAQLDPETTQGLALPHYQKFIELTTDTEKYKKELVEAYEYLGYYYFVKDDLTQSKAAWQKVKELDPTNTKADEFFKSLKK